MSEESLNRPARSHPLLCPSSTVPAQNLRLELNAANLATFYSNFFRVTGTFEELILDFGLHTGSILPTGPEPVKFSHSAWFSVSRPPNGFTRRCRLRWPSMNKSLA